MARRQKAVVTKTAVNVRSAIFRTSASPLPILSQSAPVAISKATIICSCRSKERWQRAKRIGWGEIQCWMTMSGKLKGPRGLSILMKRWRGFCKHILLGIAFHCSSFGAHSLEGSLLHGVVPGLKCVFEVKMHTTSATHVLRTQLASTTPTLLLIAFSS